MGSAVGDGRRALLEEVPVGYKRTEVGVIPEEWNVDRIDQNTSIKTGSKNTQDRQEDGDYPFFVRSQEVERINSYSYDGEAVLTAGDGVGTGKVFHYIQGRFDVHQRVYRITDFSGRLNGRYFFYQFSTGFYNRIMSMTAKSSVDSVRLEMIAGMKIPMPPLAEQRALAEALSDVDELLAALEALIAKKRAVKQAAMQELLTGKSRLPGFSGAWETKRIGDLFESTAGGDFDSTRSSDVQSDSHPYPIYANGLSQEGLYGFCNYAESRLGSITITARGTLGEAFYRDTPFVAIGRLLVLEPKVRMDARFFSSYINHSIHFAVESTGVPQLTAPQVARYSLPVPPEPEQRAISETLSDMDAETAALERRRDKTRAVKQGMMQQLLTGRVRLVSDLGNEDYVS